MTTPTRRNSLSSAQFSRLVMTVVLAAALIWLLTTAMHVLLPMVFALVVGVVFAPLADILDRWGAPSILGALAVLLLVLASILLEIIAFCPVFMELAQRIPLMWYEVQDVLRDVKSFVESFRALQERMTDALSTADAPEAQPAEGETMVPTTQDVLSMVPAFAGQVMIFVGILYFFLLVRSDFYEAVERNTARLTKKVLCQAGAQVSRYFLTITAINAAFGCLVALMLQALGMPNAIYWGVGAFLVNFVLYLGPITFAFVLLIGGIFVFDGVMSFAPAAFYLLMNMTEGQFVTPSLVGRHMKVNPLLVFASLVTWMWLWGPLGGVIAIPLMVWLRQIHKAFASDPEAEPKVISKPVVVRRMLHHAPAE